MYLKPDWYDAPKWATYLAQDECGTWHWFENEPIAGNECWHGGGRRAQATPTWKAHWSGVKEERPVGGEDY